MEVRLEFLKQWKVRVVIQLWFCGRAHNNELYPVHAGRAAVHGGCLCRYLQRKSTFLKFHILRFPSQRWSLQILGKNLEHSISEDKIQLSWDGRLQFLFGTLFLFPLLLETAWTHFQYVFDDKFGHFFHRPHPWTNWNGWTLCISI